MAEDTGVLNGVLVLATMPFFLYTGCSVSDICPPIRQVRKTTRRVSLVGSDWQGACLLADVQRQRARMSQPSRPPSLQRTGKRDTDGETAHGKAVSRVTRTSAPRPGGRKERIQWDRWVR